LVIEHNIGSISGNNISKLELIDTDFYVNIFKGFSTTCALLEIALEPLFELYYLFSILMQNQNPKVLFQDLIQKILKHSGFPISNKIEIKSFEYY